MSIKTKVFLKKEELHNIGHDKIQFFQTLFSIFFKIIKNIKITISSDNQTIK
jgi:hypothetical protein